MAERLYHETLKLLGLQDLIVDQRIESLLQIQPELLLNRIPPTIPFNTTQDGESIKTQTFQDGGFKLLPGSLHLDVLHVQGFVIRKGFRSMAIALNISRRGYRMAPKRMAEQIE